MVDRQLGAAASLSYTEITSDDYRYYRVRGATSFVIPDFQIPNDVVGCGNGAFTMDLPANPITSTEVRYEQVSGPGSGAWEINYGGIQEVGPNPGQVTFDPIGFPTEANMCVAGTYIFERFVEDSDPNQNTCETDQFVVSPSENGTINFAFNALIAASNLEPDNEQWRAFYTVDIDDDGGADCDPEFAATGGECSGPCSPIIDFRERTTSGPVNKITVQTDTATDFICAVWLKIAIPAMEVAGPGYGTLDANGLPVSFHTVVSPVGHSTYGEVIWFDNTMVLNGRLHEKTEYFVKLTTVPKRPAITSLPKACPAPCHRAPSIAIPAEGPKEKGSGVNGAQLRQ